MGQALLATPAHPYYVVIFTSRLRGSAPGYAEMAVAMEELAASRDGYLGRESARGADLLGISVSYWRDEAAIKAWKAEARHLVAQELGHERWYESFHLRVARVERAYSGPRAGSVLEG